MFNKKNITPRILAAYTAFVLALPLAIGFTVFNPKWYLFVAVLVATFLFAWSVISFAFEQFVNQKIKLIYKLINQTKATRREEIYYKYILPEKTLDEAKEDVEQWAEQRSNEIEQLRSNEAYRKEFLQNLAHEIKTPLFAIQGYVDTLLGGALENPAVNKRFLQNAARNVDRMVTLVNDLDEISKLESGEQPLTVSYFIVQDLIREVYESLSIESAARNIKSSIKRGCETPVWVKADSEKVRQVVINLVSNAIKYGKLDGHITASVYRTDERHVLIEISDDGIGIGEEHLNRIFERFYRADKDRSRNVGGSGIGLAICKHIVEAHGQTIHVRSTKDIGTTIGFTLESR